MSFKQGTNFTMRISFGDFSLDDVALIEVVFKTRKDRNAPIFKSCKYPENASRVEGTNDILVTWTKDETYKLSTSRTFFMDTRIFVNGVLQNPSTDIVELTMSPTLFDEGELE